MHDDPPLDRRAFLAAVAAGGASALIPAPTPSTLDPNRVPVWHPAASGFNHPFGLTVRRDLDPATATDVVLHGTDARLWCLCGGRNSETDLVRILVADHNTPRPEAEEVVASFLRNLYRRNLLVPSDPRNRAAFTSREREAPPEPGGPECRPTTA